jgi:hypothetical protein
LFSSPPELLLALDAGKALRAIHGTIGLGLERNASFLTTACADGSEILMRSARGVLPSIAAALAPLGLILEALFSVELLLACRKHEFLSAVFTNKRLVFKHDKYPLF